MPLRCVYTDLDGTLLGRGSSLFRDAEGGFSLAQARGLEACHRAGVEVVIMSGRREPQVHEAARLMGQTSYIYEAGCAFAIDGETTLLTGRPRPRRGRHRLREDRAARHPQAALRALRGPARVPLALAPRPRPLPPLPRQGRRRRSQRAARGRGPRRPASARQRRDRPRDGGDRRSHPRLPPGAEAGRQGERRRRPCPRPRPRPRRVHRRRRLGRGPRGRRRGRPLLRRRQRAPSATPACASPCPPGTTSPSPMERWATASTRRSSPP